MGTNLTNPIAQSIMQATLNAMQTAEEITGDMPLEDYEALMQEIAAEACQRIVNMRLWNKLHPPHTVTDSFGQTHVLVKVDPNGN